MDKENESWMDKQIKEAREKLKRSNSTQAPEGIVHVGSTGEKLDDMSSVFYNPLTYTDAYNVNNLTFSDVENAINSLFKDSRMQIVNHSNNKNMKREKQEGLERSTSEVKEYYHTFEAFNGRAFTICIIVLEFSPRISYKIVQVGWAIQDPNEDDYNEERGENISKGRAYKNPINYQEVGYETIPNTYYKSKHVLKGIAVEWEKYIKNNIFDFIKSKSFEVEMSYKGLLKVLGDIE